MKNLDKGSVGMLIIEKHVHYTTAGKKFLFLLGQFRT